MRRIHPPRWGAGGRPSPGPADSPADSPASHTSNTGRRRRVLSHSVVGALAAGMLAALPVAAQAAVAPAVSTAVNPDSGFPEWYQDANGLRLQPCLRPNEPCLAGSTVPDPTQPPSVPSNFSSESFYYNATATMNVGSAKATFVAGLEQAFGNTAGTVATGDQITFGRIQWKVTAGALTPNTTYTVVDPYGTENLTTGSDGSILPTKTPNARDQVGCGATPPACDFGLALGSRVLNGFLRPAAPAPAPPAGFIGDAVTPVPVTGSPTGNNVFKIVAPDGTTVASTNLFTLSGKVAGPLLSDPPRLQFGGQVVGTTTTKTLTLTNVTPSALTVTSGSTAGTDFTFTGSTCTNVAPDSTCTATVSYSPVVTGAGTDVLTLASSNAAGAQPAVKIPLSGTGLAAGTTPKASLSPASVVFGDQKVGSTSVSQKVTLSNPGTAPLNVFGVNIGGANATDFKIASNGCTTVAAGASCDIGVSFAPTADGARSASLTVSDDAADSPQSVSLTGLAHAGLAAVSPTLNAGSGFPDWYEDSAGIRLTACINPADPCLAGSTVPDPTQPARVPTNYPNESFYYNATAVANVAGGGKASYTAALEQAFGNTSGVAAAGDQITFGRIEVKASGLTPGAKYTVTEPYGTMTLTAAADGTITPIKTAGAREQTGCGFVPPACDFGLALGSRVGPFLTRSPANDPATVPVPKTGFIGDAVTPMKVVGSPFDTNVFTIKDSAGNVVASTDLFTVAGKEAGPLVATPTNLAFGDEPTGTNSLAQQVTITNLGATSLTLGTAKATGPFAVVAGTNTCDGANLAQDGSCTVSVTFNPTALGKATGTLSVASTTGDLVKVALTGNGAAPPASNASLSASTLTFAPQHVGTTSAPQTVTVKNTGAATLNFDATTPVALAPATVTDFKVASNTCTGTLAAGATCDTSVTFSPAAATVSNATLTLSDDSGGSASTQTVALTGTGAQPTANLSAGTLAFGDVAVNTASSPQTVTVTNNGNEDLVIGNVALTGTNAADFGFPPSACPTPVPAGSSCSVDVTFKPGTTGAKSASLTFTDNAGTQSVSLTGNGVVPATSSVTAPSQRFTEAGMPLKIAIGKTLPDSTMPIALRWSPVGTAPVDHYELQSSVNGGVMATASTPAGAVTSDAAVLKIGSATAPQTYQFQVRACASPGTTSCSPYSTGPKFTVSPLDDTGVAASAFKGTWKTAALAGAYGGTVHWSTRATSTVTNSVTFNVTGNVAIGSTMGPDRGRFSVAVDGKTVAPSVDLYSATVQPATVPVAVDGVAAGSHTVAITVLKTKNALSKGNRVDLDTYVILK